ncbi:hypothetical protein [Streptomyces phytohabitans]|uniref:hypothetical protein n=1 Tax=Streptomyces phytohabitans TaxID=1150371 RepID=UPI00345BB7B7
MRVENFGDVEVEVTDLDDVTAQERVLEFRTSAAKNSFAAVSLAYGGRWSDARLSIDPLAGDLSADLVGELIVFARRVMEWDRSA